MSKTHDQECKSIADNVLETLSAQLDEHQTLLTELKINPNKLSIKVTDPDDGREIQYTYRLVNWCVK